MTKSIHTQCFRGLRATFATALAMMIAFSCITIPGVIEPPAGCSCDCVCNDGRTFCGSSSIKAGTEECSNDCFRSGTEKLVCKDETREDVVLPPFDPPDPVQCSETTPHLFQPFAFCKICTEFPASETDLFLRACTQEEAQGQAEAIAEADGGESQDCSITVDVCE